MDFFAIFELALQSLDSVVAVLEGSGGPASLHPQLAEARAVIETAKTSAAAFKADLANQKAAEPRPPAKK